MIEKFSYINAIGIELQLNLGVDGYLFEGHDGNEVRFFHNSNSKGLRWEYSGKVVEILEHGKCINGMPTPDMKRVVVTYPYDHPVYPSPNNAVVYNADGSVYMQLNAPKLISGLAKQQGSVVPHTGVIDLFFSRVHWEKNSEGKVVTAVSFDFSWEWHEERELDPETGEFGACLGS
jgi:hypothetical protein